MSSFCLVSVLVAPELDAAMTDFLLEHGQLIAAFSTHAVEAHGAGVPLDNPSDQVQGHTRRIEFRLILPDEQAVLLLDRLKESPPGPDIVFWQVPVCEFGRVS